MRAALVLALVFGTVSWAPGLAARAAAQPEPAESVTLRELLEVVRERSPAARAIRARADVADADVDLAGVYPNPSLGYQFMGRFDGSNQAINGSQHTAWLEVPLLVASQHDARRAAAAGDARAARADEEVELLALEVRARRAFVSLLAAQDRVARLAAARRELDAIRGIVEGRAEAGAQSQYDGARVRLEISRVDAQLASARADVTAARAAIAALVGRPAWLPRAEGSLESLRAQIPRPEELPAVRAMRLRTEAARLDVERTERERVPEISVGLGTYLTSDPDSASVYAGISVPLPIFDTGDAAVRRARAARDAAADAEAAVSTEARALLAGRVAALRERRAALARFDADTLARLPEIQQMAEASYRLGASGVFELLDTFRTRFELELQRIELLVDVIESETDVIALVGR